MIIERRDYYRIEDKVLLRCMTIDQNAALANRPPREFKEAPGYSLMTDLHRLEGESNSLLHIIAEHDRDISAYLKLINKKVDTIANYIVASSQLDEQQEPVHISLSEGGLSFQSEEEHAPDSYLAIQITLLPTHTNLIVYAKVINCSTHKAGGYSIAVSFIHLKEGERQQIAKHVLQFQLAQKREAQEA